MKAFFHRLCSPRYFYHYAAACLPYVRILGVLLVLIGMVWGLAYAPADYQQGEGFRIIYIHVPAASTAMGIYLGMAISSLVFIIWRIKLAAIWVRVSAPIGASFCFLALFTGAVWGKPMWGTWWIWDARLTSTLILFFLYMGVIGLQNAMTHRDTADRAGCFLALLGSLNLPIIHYSVYWWNTLHQGASLLRFAKPSIDASMLYPLLINVLAFFLIYLASALQRMQCEIMIREHKASWLTEKGVA